MISLQINGQLHELEINPEMPLLWAIRDFVGLTGTKYGCGKAQCGACTVHVDGRPIRSCTVSVASISGQNITTIEGLNSKVGQAVQAAWNELQVPQCGFCQSGQIMSATALLERKPDPSDHDVNLALQGNICRCATYTRIRAAVKSASMQLTGGTASNE